MNHNRIDISPSELDKQSPIKIDKWLNIDSEECREKDPDHSLTKKWLRIGLEDKFLFTDSQGRLWGRGKQSNQYFPYHFNVGEKLYGFRLAATAVN